jgi:membrane carboxypeptidase/penicillin-binding protein
VNHGQRVEPRVIARATDASGEDLISQEPSTRQVIDPGTAYMLTDMLSAVVDHGTARAARGAVKNTAIAGKTGTSRDGWFVGFTPYLVCAVWIGFDDNTQLGLTGAEAALPAWVDFVKSAVDLRPELGGKAFDRPEGISIEEIDPETGMLATGSCPQRERVALTTAFASNADCYKHSRALMDGSQVAAAHVPAEAVTEDWSRGAGTPRRGPTRFQTNPVDDNLRTTTVETRANRQQTLVNDLRVTNKR